MSLPIRKRTITNGPQVVQSIHLTTVAFNSILSDLNTTEIDLPICVSSQVLGSLFFTIDFPVFIDSYIRSDFWEDCQTAAHRLI